MKSQDIRKQFIEFFKARGHNFVRSSAVVPLEDPTLLFTNAGMNQFKPIFLGQEEASTLRAVNSQKCIRVSGKHNDLEEVGVDDYHHTFFEMLGNWSFGDYYKKEAISWAWELLTEVWKIDKNRLWVTIFKDDDEAGEIWRHVTDIAPNRILKFGHKDNFWEMGDTGPCGPCSEIHYYSGDEPENQNPEGVNHDDDYREIWNLVFIQYNRKEDRSLENLPACHVDTGAGFERIVALLNGVKSNYNTDLFQPLTNAVVEITGRNLTYQDGIPHRVIADHLRMLSFSIADGAMPGNEGRGYVLRRVLRRAARFGRTLDMHEPFIYKLVPILAKIMGSAFPEIIEKQAHIEKVIAAEETSFGETLDRGLDIFEKITNDLKPGDIIPGQEAFRLYDTFGFPLDLTQLMAREKDLSVDTEEFNKAMSRQKERARAAGKFQLTAQEDIWVDVSEGESSRFLGYDQRFDRESVRSHIRRYRVLESKIHFILDQTPFYAEKGGQMGDIGEISLSVEDQGISLKVTDAIWEGDDIVHICAVDADMLNSLLSSEALTLPVEVCYDSIRRQQIRLNHTATHLMHKALRQVLGDHVQQAGSMVAPDRLRFDLTHYAQITPNELRLIEQQVNEQIRANSPVETVVMNYDEAREDGAVALFGEKYDDLVRVITVTNFSKELCGGTHVSSTGEIGMFRIISETALSAGIRRVEAITGSAVEAFLNERDSIVEQSRTMLKCRPAELPQRIQMLISERKDMEKQLQQLNSLTQREMVKDLLENAEKIGSVRIVVEQLQDPGDLKELGDKLREGLGKSGIALIGTVTGSKPQILCAVTDDIKSIINAGNLVREVGRQIDGGGGGKPHLATAGGKDANKLPRALEFGANRIRELLTEAKL